MKKALLSIFSAFVLIALLVPSASAVVTYEGTTATGILGLDILGTTYNVTFINNGTTYDEFVSTYGQTFNTQGDARDAIAAINAELNAELTVPNSVGDSFGFDNEYYIPYYAATDDVRAARSFIDINGTYALMPDDMWNLFDSDVNSIANPAGRWNGDWDVDRDTDPNIPWAHFTPVPVPAAVWLLGSGLLGIVGLRKKIQ